MNEWKRKKRRKGGWGVAKSTERKKEGAARGVETGEVRAMADVWEEKQTRSERGVGGLVEVGDVDRRGKAPRELVNR